MQDHVVAVVIELVAGRTALEQQLDAADFRQHLSEAEKELWRQAELFFALQGELNLGLQDAVNLGWKLAAQVRGWAPPGLLDSYHDERHPVAARVLVSTRAQGLLTVPEPDVLAVRTVVTDLVGVAAAGRLLAMELSGLGIRYGSAGGGSDPNPDPDPELGGRAADVALPPDGRAVLVGDAAHATSPSSGQGASLSIESAVQLARCLRDLPVPAAFEAYEQLRRARVEKVMPFGARGTVIPDGLWRYMDATSRPPAAGCWRSRTIRTCPTG